MQLIAQLKPLTLAVSVLMTLSACTGMKVPAKKPAEMVQGPPITDIFTPFDLALTCLKGQFRPDIAFSVGAVTDLTGKEVVANGGSGKFVTQGGGEMVQSALFQAGVTLLNRRDPRIIEAEQKFGIRDVKKMRASDYFVTGSINSLDFIPGGGFDIEVGGVGPMYSQTRIIVGLDLSLTDAKTSQIVANVALQKQIVAQDFALNSGRFVGRTLFNVQIGGGEREATNFALRQMLNLATFELLSQVIPPSSFAECRAKIPAEFGSLSLTRSSVSLHRYNLEVAKAKTAEAAKSKTVAPQAVVLAKADAKPVSNTSLTNTDNPSNAVASSTSINPTNNQYLANKAVSTTAEISSNKDVKPVVDEQRKKQLILDEEEQQRKKLLVPVHDESLPAQKISPKQSIPSISPAQNIKVSDAVLSAKPQIQAFVPTLTKAPKINVLPPLILSFNPTNDSEFFAKNSSKSIKKDLKDSNIQQKNPSSPETEGLFSSLLEAGFEVESTEQLKYKPISQIIVGAKPVVVADADNQITAPNPQNEIYKVEQKTNKISAIQDKSQPESDAVKTNSNQFTVKTTALAEENNAVVVANFPNSTTIKKTIPSPAEIDQKELALQYGLTQSKDSVVKTQVSDQASVITQTQTEFSANANNPTTEPEQVANLIKNGFERDNQTAENVSVNIKTDIKPIDDEKMVAQSTTLVNTTIVKPNVLNRPIVVQANHNIEIAEPAVKKPVNTVNNTDAKVKDTQDTKIVVETDRDDEKLPLVIRGEDGNDFEFVETDLKAVMTEHKDAQK